MVYSTFGFKYSILYVISPSNSVIAPPIKKGRNGDIFIKDGNINAPRNIEKLLNPSFNPIIDPLKDSGEWEMTDESVTIEIVENRESMVSDIKNTHRFLKYNVKLKIAESIQPT